MRTIFFTTIVVILMIIGIAVNNHASRAGVTAVSHIEEVNTPIINDTIRLADGSIFVVFSDSFLSVFEGYRDLFRNREDITFIVTLGSAGNGHVNTWVEKDGKIYLENTSFQLIDLTPLSSGECTRNVVLDVGTPPSSEEWQEMLEELTGEKFNEEGLLPANWLTGTFRFGRLVRAETRPIPSLSFCRVRQYTFHFYEGRVTKKEVTEAGVTRTYTSAGGSLQLVP